MHANFLRQTDRIQRREQIDNEQLNETFRRRMLGLVQGDERSRDSI